MSRRGPDGYSKKELPIGTLHHSLLAINGQQKQPIEYGGWWTAYNGEIYNAHEIGSSPEQDALAMAAGFADEGMDFFHRLNGDWAFIQASDHTVVAVRGRFGLHPLFRYYDGEHLIYASNLSIIKEALKGADRKLKVNEAYPPKGRVPLPSFYHHVEPLPAGTVETAVRSGTGWSIHQARWYRPSAVNHGKLSDVIENAVHLRIHDRGVVAVSGGVDSFVLQAHTERMPLYHLNVTGERDEATQLGAVILSPPRVRREDIQAAQEQPYYATSPNFFLAKAIKEYDPSIRVVLTGIGADELFGGYPHHKHPYNDETYHKVYGIDRNPDCRDWRSAELEHAIPHHYGYRTDQMFLWHGIEVRHPYLDHRVVETALCQEPNNKKVLRDIARELGWKEKKKKGFAADLSSFVADREESIH